MIHGLKVLSTSLPDSFCLPHLSFWSKELHLSSCSCQISPLTHPFLTTHIKSWHLQNISRICLVLLLWSKSSLSLFRLSPWPNWSPHFQTLSLFHLNPPMILHDLQAPTPVHHAPATLASKITSGLSPLHRTFFSSKKSVISLNRGYPEAPCICKVTSCISWDSYHPQKSSHFFLENLKQCPAAAAASCFSRVRLCATP